MRDGKTLRKGFSTRRPIGRGTSALGEGDLQSLTQLSESTVSPASAASHIAGEPTASLLSY